MKSALLMLAWITLAVGCTNEKPAVALRVAEAPEQAQPAPQPRPKPGETWAIEVLHGCSDDETKHDLSYSVRDPRGTYKLLHVEIRHVQGVKECGYRLRKGSESKLLKGAWTDVDLAVEVESFFGVRVLEAWGAQKNGE